MRTDFFQPTINGWGSWGKIFCSIPAFSPLIHKIFQKEGLECGKIQNLTPGTNAVFRCGNYVVKIYVPKESGIDGSIDFQMEKTLLQYVTQLGIVAPKLISTGEWIDRYRFLYLIMEYVEGWEAGGYLSHSSQKEKVEAVRQLKELFSILHRPAREISSLPVVDLKRRAIENFRLEKLNGQLAKDIRERISHISLEEAVLVHGDITGENVIVNPHGKLILIDFADAHLAPPCYELPPLLFELFQFDRELVTEWIGDGDRELFFDSLLDGLALHDFGADIILSFLERKRIPSDCINSLGDFRKILKKILNENKHLN